MAEIKKKSNLIAIMSILFFGLTLLVNHSCKKNAYGPRDKPYPCESCYEDGYCDTICGENATTCPNDCL